MEPMLMIAAKFKEAFHHWQIILPSMALETLERGELHKDGWTIQYLFSQDENGRYLDYYATHRMTNDRHERIYESGEVVHLEAPLEFMIFPKDSTEEDRERIKTEYFAENRRIYEMLAQKGFR